jgi:NAD(P)-dependent dehydrogenase (short-subunit alcohol dehydrogenase family)
MTARFPNTVALVAGGTGGLGRAVTLAFLEESAKVIVTYRKQEEFDALKTASGPSATSLEGHKTDVTDEDAVSLLFQTILTRQGRLDAMINTVGAFAGGAKLWEADARILDQMLTPNLRSGFVLARAAVRAMLPRRRGSIVNVASKAALDHAPGVAAYAASKAAALAMIDSLAAELKGTGVRANSILPSIIDTEANRKAMPSADFSKWPKPHEIARVILFLCTEDAALINGAAIPVYGDS